MIIDAIRRTLALPFTFLLGLFPDITLPAWMCTATTGDSCLPAKAQGLAVHLGPLDKFLPLSDGLLLFELFLAMVLAVLVFKVMIFVYGLVRG